MFIGDDVINKPTASTVDEAVRILEIVYGEAISALKVVYSIGGQAFIASNINMFIADRVLGIALLSGSAGYNGKVQIAGILEDPSWNWNNGAIYLGINGTLTQTPPSTGFSCQVGVAASPTKMVVGIKNSVLIA